MKLVKPTEMYTYDSGGGEFKTVGVSPIRQLDETLLDRSFNDVDVFRTITNKEIVHLKTAFNTRRNSFNDRADF